LDEHRLADEEVVEVEQQVEVRVGHLFERQLDVAPDRESAPLLAALVGGLHDPGASAGDDGEPGLGQLPPHRPRRLVHRIVPTDPRRAEQADGGGDGRQLGEPVDELGQDPERPPRVGPDEAVVAAFEQRPVGVRLLPPAPSGGMGHGCHYLPDRGRPSGRRRRVTLATVPLARNPRASYSRTGPPPSAVSRWTRRSPFARLSRTARPVVADATPRRDRKSTRLNSSHVAISYAVFCLKKKSLITSIMI